MSLQSSGAKKLRLVGVESIETAEKIEQATAHSVLAASLDTQLIAAVALLLGRLAPRKHINKRLYVQQVNRAVLIQVCLYLKLTRTQKVNEWFNIQ